MKCKAKISDFSYSIMYEYIRNFQIAVNDVFRTEILKSFIDISNHAVYFYFFKLLLFLDFILKVSFIAKFCDNIAISIASEDLKASENVGMVHLFEYFYLWEEELL